MNILLLSGGSGGHLVPAMALAEHLLPADRCFLVSTRRPVDRILSADSRSSLEWETVGLQPFTPVWRWLSPGYVAAQTRAVRKIYSVMDKTRPDVVVGFGGYLSAVGVMAARGMGIPAVIHEQNILPGRANRWLSWVADAVAVSFPETGRYFPKRAAVETTGNPLRLKPGETTAERARAELGLDPVRPVLLVMGGSQGSRAVNRLVLGMWELFSPARRKEIQVLHLAGPTESGKVEGTYRVVPFLRRMDLALSAAALAVSRAGATAIAEMAAMGVPSILIPYPHAGAHQRANAEWAREIGGAIILEEKELSAERLKDEVEGLLGDPGRLEKMREALWIHSNGVAAQRLGELVKRVAQR